jgi:hypothetical protein
MALTFLLWLFVIPEQSAAGMYACTSIDGNTYTETPSRPDCRLLEIQPPPVTLGQDNSRGRFFARPSAPWPQGSAEAQAEICSAYRDWISLGEKRKAYPGNIYSPSLTPQELNRVQNLDLLFSHRGRPNCARE